MPHRAWPLVVVVLAAFLAALPSPAALGDADCTNRFTEPSSGHVTIEPGFGVVTGTNMYLQLMPDGNSDAMIWDSVRFHVDGPSTADVPASDGRGGGFYTPSKEGHYTVTGTWMRYDCGDPGRQTTTTGSTPPAPFDVIPGERPGATFSTTKRVRHKFSHNGLKHTTPGDAALHVQAKCPRDEVATHEPLRVDLYWTTNGSKASHSSRHVGSRSATGCYSSKSTHMKSYSAKLNASASGTGGFIDVFEPLVVNVLVEVHSGTALVAARRAVFRRSSTGEGVKVGPA
jgi:hypothetical protein